MPRRSAPIRVKNDGSFEAKGRRYEDVLDEFESEMRKEVSFDAHFVTSKIIEFGKILTGIPLYRYQEKSAYRIIYSVISLEGATITMLFSRQSGKTEALSFVVNSLCVLLPALAKVFPDLDQYRNGFHVGLFAPQSEQVWTTYNRSLLRLTSQNAEMVMSDPDLEVELDRPNRYSLSNGSALTGQTASTKSKIEGKTYHLVLCEEAQDLDTYLVQKSIEPMVTATGGTIVKCGTTGTEKNDFWYEIQYNRNKSRHVEDKRLIYHFEFNYKAIIEDKLHQYSIDGKMFHLNYAKDVRKKEERWGRDSQAFKLSFALEWDLESGMLITDQDFEKITNKRKGFSVDEHDIVVAGLDIGKDEASTVLTIGKVVWNPEEEDDSPPKIEVCGWVELPRIDYETQHHMIVEALLQYNVRSLYVDYTGVGRPFVDRLNYAVGDVIEITEYTFTRESKSDMWFNLIDHIQQGRLIIPANKTVRSTQEFRNFEEQIKNCVKYHDGPFLVCHKSVGYLDDYVDSLGLMLLAPNFEIAEEVEIDVFNPFFEGQLQQRHISDKMNW